MAPVDHLRRARTIMRALQRDAAAGIATAGTDDAHAAARHAAQAYEREAVLDGAYARIGPFRHPLVTERARWRHTLEVVDRCAPGPHEDGNYLALLARQAATIELHLSGPGVNPAVPAATRRIVFGTTGRPGSHASAHLAGDAAAVLMSAGMIYFLYQAAKSVVLAWKPIEAPDGSLTAFSTRDEDTREVLDRDPAAAEWLCELLSSWLFAGVARPPASAAPPPAYQPALSLLIGCSERFILAHEYTHALVDLMRPAGLDVDPLPDGWRKELRADAWGVAMVVESAAAYDGFAPNMALQGPVLAMKAHEVVDRALALVRPTATSPTHPPFERRLEAVLDAYLALPGIAGDPDLAPEPALTAARTLELLWEKILPRLEQRMRSGERLHPIWTNPT